MNDTNYKINYEGITDTLIVPYQVEIDGEMYRVTEVNLTVTGKNWCLLEMLVCQILRI